MHALRGAALAAVALLAGCGRSGTTDTPAPPPPPGLHGRIVLAGGAPAAGMMVTAKDAKGIETSVVTDAQGAWSIDRLADGEYAVTARGGGRRVAAARAKLAGGRAEALALTAADDPDFLAQLPSANVLALLPDGPMKQEFVLNCGTCHEIGYRRIVKDGKVRDAAKWLEAIRLMRSFDVYKVIPPDFDDAAYAKWLAESLSAERLATLKPEPPLDPTLAGRLRITEYPLPRPDELPHDLVVGPDGRIWVTAFWHGEMWALNPSDGAIETFPVNDQPKASPQTRALEFDREGLLWMINGGTQSVVMLDPKTRKFETFPVGMYAHDIGIDSRGNVWFNDYFAARERIGTLDRATKKVRYFDLPSAKLPAKEGIPLAYGMQIDARDRLWSTQLAANTLARFDIATGAAKLYTMPTPNAGPRRTAVDASGGLWIPEFNTGVLVRFDPETEKFESYDTGNRALGSYDVAVSPKTGDVWMSGALHSSMLRFDPKSKTFEEIRLPTEPAYVRHVGVDPKSGDVWVPYSSLPTAVPKVARIELR